ncbi:MAG TPA: 16S rRNA (cytidine(1402)-2'-O)-methyltransferase [candidate division Zixibacteria bacterium]|nr:16S rRNA (cytidine(1402)-2'-O)-methyltransferase [candidate division Zixibacteria bacterium]
MPDGKIIFVPTPIGNLEDITLRALRVLSEADFIAAEDTRTAKKLFAKFEINSKTISYHVKNERRVAERIIEAVGEGKTVAVISESGTPGISDPGWTLIRTAIDADVPFEVLPGANALVPAVLYSGFPVTGFSFEGFLPHSGKGRRRRLRVLAGDSPRTMVFYESPHRVGKFLADALEILGDREAVICRELTKMFEEIIRGKISELIEQVDEIKGEVVIVITPAQKVEE